MLEAEAKDQGHKRKRSSKNKKGLQKFFHAISKKSGFYEILTIQKIVLSLSRGQGNFRGLEASTPRP